MRKTSVERFKSKIGLDAKTGCWLWLGSRHPTGYGQFSIKFKKMLAHRYAWSLENGPVPEGLYVCHKCDNPPCCNPAHLFIGTQKDNLADMKAKGRAPDRHKTHCRRGHEFTPENTAYDQGGASVCKRCRSDAQLRYKARNLDAVREYQRNRARRIRQEHA